MSKQLHIHPRPAPLDFPIPKVIRIERSDRCINCGRCIESCIYECHERSAADPRKMADPKEGCCRRCLSCVLNCPRGALSMHPNEAFQDLGDPLTYKPEVVCSIQEQAAAGKIPVSGAGYGGAFDGDYYDNIWTDMSEIVRPTRDGIHGREHISTTVSLGRMIRSLCDMEFDAGGNLKSLIPQTREIPIPVLFGQLPFSPGPGVLKSMVLASSILTNYTAIHPSDLTDDLMEYFNHLILRLRPEQIEESSHLLEWSTIIEIEGDNNPEETKKQARRYNPQMLYLNHVPVVPDVEKHVLELVQKGAETVHLSADINGSRDVVPGGLLGALDRTHRLLVETGLRDRITLIASGGVAIAEHVPKTIIFGADAVMVGVPLLIALGCDLCGKCQSNEPCPKKLNEVDPRWGASRIINLMLCWRDQLLEVLGAMGIRDVRRLRGEKGRAIFADKANVDFLTRLKEKAPLKKKVNERFSTAKLKAKQGDAPGRFAIIPGSYHVHLDRERCTDCGLCIETCPYDVFSRREGYLRLEDPEHFHCIGTSCLENDWCCANVCPWEALKVTEGNTDRVLGDKRWTAEMLRETYREAKTGQPYDRTSELTGDSGGGFDLLRLSFPENIKKVSEESVDLSIPLNKREGPRITIPLPIYGGGMSYGSISLDVMVGRAKAATELGTFTSTGEGGYPDELIPYRDHMITQVATGLFGVREETIARSRICEFKYAQGAKPGLGGHLLAEKNTPDVASMREAVPFTGLFSPFPFHSVYSVEDHKKHVDWLRIIRPDLLISVKVSTPGDVDMVAVGSYHAGANIVHLDGAYGGTGAAPDIAKKNIAMPIEYAITQVHDFLVAEEIRDEVVLIASGGIRTPDDVLKAIALGADGVVIGTAELVAVDCVRCGNCERDRGCPLGIATTDHELARQMTSDWVKQRIVNMYLAWSKLMRRRLARFGLASIRELSGRRDLVSWIGKEAEK